jgi:hypothetical protein
VVNEVDGAVRRGGPVKSVQVRLRPMEIQFVALVR